MDRTHKKDVSTIGASEELCCCTFDEDLSCFHFAVYEDVIIAEHLYSTALVLIVSRRSPRKLRVHNYEEGKEMGTYSYSNNIVAVKVNLSRVVVCLKETIHVHDIQTMEERKELACNHRGLVALSSAETSYIAYATSSTFGQVDVFDAVNLSVVLTIDAHDSPLAALTLNRSGSLLATASNKGTVIRVFSLPYGDRLFEFCRGMTRLLSETLSCIWRSSSAWTDYLSRSATNYLPTQMSDILQRETSFAYARLQFPSSFSSLALIRYCYCYCTSSHHLQLLVASVDGFLYCYSVPLDGGGCECQLIQQHDLLVQASQSATLR
ncbi:unnamed protein product [Anisakis simplex]|uniref:WD repeat domain phosphoinositide-interacting protein 1 (inferred by orthology to a human protein) n=1 Tax=Anisakis simplex TaxID=6269 RepID=A0A0M3K021_ANISI|nr:unnamed protein product [Anisakis simplex]